MQVMSTYDHLTTLEELTKALGHALDDAGDDRIAEGQLARTHPSEIYCAPVRLILYRERLTDGSYVYNLSLTNSRA